MPKQQGLLQKLQKLTRQLPTLKQKLTLRYLIPAHRPAKPDQRNQHLKQNQKLLKQSMTHRTDSGSKERYYV